MEIVEEGSVRNAALDSFVALMGEEPEVAHAFLLAAIYARAIQLEMSPRDVLEDLFKALPSAAHWRSLRRGLEAMLED